MTRAASPSAAIGVISPLHLTVVTNNAAVAAAAALSGSGVLTLCLAGLARVLPDAPSALLATSLVATLAVVGASGFAFGWVAAVLTRRSYRRYGSLLTRRALTRLLSAGAGAALLVLLGAIVMVGGLTVDGWQVTAGTFLIAAPVSIGLAYRGVRSSRVLI